MAVSLLIVDDSEIFRRHARRLLEADGFDVVGEAYDAASALVAVRDLRPDVVLLDVVLPGRDGFSVCSAITASPEAPAVVLTSSREASTYRRRLAESRALAFMPKGQLDSLAELLTR